MKPFRFQNFEIAQQADVFRVGTDGVLLGVLSDAGTAKQVLEVGTGTGLVALMLAQRNPDLVVTALDVNPEAVALASSNFGSSPYAERLNAVQVDFKSFQSDRRFDLIISNPPYFEVNSSGKDVYARQTMELDASILLDRAGELLTDSGLISLIIPSVQSSGLEQTARQRGLHLIRKINIFGIAGGPVKRNVLEFSKKEIPATEQEFVIEKSPRVYSEQYLDATRDFHVFGKTAK